MSLFAIFWPASRLSVVIVVGKMLLLKVKCSHEVILVVQSNEKRRTEGARGGRVAKKHYLPDIKQTD